MFPSIAKTNRDDVDLDATVAVARLPICDFCLDWSEYRGRTSNGRTANMCARHFRQNGRGLGGGNGWRLVVIREVR